MSIRPIAYAANGDVTVLHEELGHGGVVAFAGVRFGRNDDGTVNADLLELPCPVAGCGGLSVHPVGGGAVPGPIQKLFLRTVLRRAVALGIPVAQRTFAALLVRVRNRVEAMDGLGRFRLAGMASEDDDPDA